MRSNVHNDLYFHQETSDVQEDPMSITLKLDLPEEAFSALRKNPAEFAAEMRLAAAVKWYEMGIISQGKAAEIAGLPRSDFIFSLARFGVSPFQYTAQEIEEELRHAD
jgi:predicted HTH domain antitoxin